MKLSKEEKSIDKSIDRGDFKPITEKEKIRLVNIFKGAAKKLTRINIRLADDDIAKLKAKANQEGLPYQTLIGSVLHKFVNGALIDLESAKTLNRLYRR